VPTPEDFIKIFIKRLDISLKGGILGVEVRSMIQYVLKSIHDCGYRLFLRNTDTKTETEIGTLSFYPECFNTKLGKSGWFLSRGKTLANEDGTFFHCPGAVKSRKLHLTPQAAVKRLKNVVWEE
jgi:hypothetical protein